MWQILTTMTTATEPEGLAESAEVETALGLIASLEEMLTNIHTTREHVPRFGQACDDMDLEGRCERLKSHLQTLAESPSIDLFQEDLQVFEVLFKDVQRFLKTLNEAKMAPKNCWERWLNRGGKYARRMARLNNKLNDTIATHIYNVSVQLPDSEVTKTFPPNVEEMQLSAPSSPEEEEPPRTALKLCRSFDSAMSGNTRRTSTTSVSSCPSSSSTVGSSLSSSIRSCRSTRSSLSSPISQSPLGSHLSGLDGSMRSVGSTRSRSSYALSTAPSSSDNDYHASTTSMLSQVSTEESGLPKIAWDFSPRTVKQDKWWGSSSNVSKSRKDRNELYVKTQVLRDMPQDMPVKELRIVLAQLEAGDTSPGIVAGRAAMMAVGALGALMVSPLVVMGGLSAKEAVTQTPLEAAAVFSHYLIEFELENGTIGTLENCVEDIYLYAGKSSRQQQHCVSRIPLTPGYVGSPDSLTQPLLLQDIIRFRNQQRLVPYRLWDNNCKHFVYLALTSGQLFPKASNYEEDSLDVFFALCQGCYVQQDCFDVFTESHTGGHLEPTLAQQIMTLWEHDPQEEEDDAHPEDDDDDEQSQSEKENETPGAKLHKLMEQDHLEPEQIVLESYQQQQL